jgi:hypothetical protein
MAFEFPYSFNELQLIFALKHFISWTIMVAVPLSFQVASVALGRLMDFLSLELIQYLALVIGPTYTLRRVQTPNQNPFISMCGVFRLTYEELVDV